MNSTYARIIRDPGFRRSLGIPPDAIDDTLQDAYLKLLQCNGGATTRPEALLRKVTRNCYKDSVKAASRRRHHERRAAAAVAHQDDDQRPSVMTECTLGSRQTRVSCRLDDAGPSRKLERRELRRAILQAVRVAELRKDHRCALWAWVRGELGDFAKRRSMSVSTARVWVHRACQALRPFLLRAGLDPAQA